VKPPRLYFSFRSPYSWLAVERLLQCVPALFDAFEVLPYWDPDANTERALAALGAKLPYQAMSKAKHRYVLGDTKRLAARLGHRIAWPVDADAWWEVPHLAWLAARQTGEERQCYDALAAARWQRGENICDRQVLRRVAAEAGLDAERLCGAVDDESVRAEGLSCLVAAYEDDVFGIPYLLMGRDRYWGFDRVDLFLDAYHRGGAAVSVGPAVEPTHGVPAEVVLCGAYDRDTPGGCG
jgi:2-hydroxychromene-2-carboxylate isomerase